MKHFKRLLVILLAAITITASLPLSLSALTFGVGTKVESFHGSEYKDKNGKTYVVPEDIPYFVFKYLNKSETVIDVGVTPKGSIKRKLMIRDYYNIDETQQVLCVEAGVPFGKYASDYVGQNAKDSKYFNNLPDDKAKYIGVACLCGWQPGKTAPYSDCTEDDFALATQVIIWEIQQGLRTSATEIDDKGEAVSVGNIVTVPADAYYSMIEGRSAEKCYNYILNKMKLHGTIPSFSNQTKEDAETITLKYDGTTKTYKATITDVNGSYQDIEFASGNISVTRSGTQYTFETKTALSEPITLCGKKEIDTLPDKMLIWSNGKDQTFATGADDPVEFYVGFRTVAEIPLTVIKTDRSGLNNVSDIEFTITSSDGTNKTYKTDENGKITVDLKPGTYTVTEIVPSGYREQAPQTVTISLGDTAKTVMFENELNTGRVYVKKASEDGIVAGIRFRLYGTSVAGAEIDITLEVDENGKVVFESIPVGEYTLEEENVPERYVVPESRKITVDGIVDVEYSFENVLRHGSLKLIKTSYDGNVRGFSFRITNDNGYDEIFVTDENGEIYVQGLLPGEYTVSEIADEVSEGYIRPDDTVAVIQFDTETVLERYNGQIPEAPNPPTGENHILLLVVLASCAACAILVVICKEK